MRPTMQPVVSESGELVINNFENGEDELVVDIATGELLSRAKVNAD